MRLTRQSDYAMRAVLYLSVKPHASIQQIAEAQGTPREYLGKILQKLARDGIVRTHRGSGGGISLARAPAAISLRDVIEAVDGPVLINSCFVTPGECRREGICAAHEELYEVQRELRRLLGQIDFAALAAREAVSGEEEGSRAGGR